MDQNYKYGDVTSAIIASAMEVHRILKNGFQEVVYQRALDVEFDKRNLKAAREIEMPIFYKEVQVGIRRVDFLVNGIICVELKAISALDDIHLAQGLNYLEAFNLEIGLLLNFGSKSLEVKRLLNQKFNPGILNKIE